MKRELHLLNPLLAIGLAPLEVCCNKPYIPFDYRVSIVSLDQIYQAEASFFVTHRTYATLNQLWGDDPDPAKRAIASGTFNGFHFDVAPTETVYSVTIWPASRRRIVSLYSDQTGVVRIALYGARATASSQIIRDHPP